MAKKIKPSTDHLVYDFKTKAFSCVRCGNSYPIKMPIEVSLFAKKSKAFTVLHIDCMEQKKGTTE